MTLQLRHEDGGVCRHTYFCLLELKSYLFNFVFRFREVTQWTPTGRQRFEIVLFICQTGLLFASRLYVVTQGNRHVLLHVWAFYSILNVINSTGSYAVSIHRMM